MGNPYIDDTGRTVVAVTRCRDSLKDDLARLLADLGDLEALMTPGDRILIKPNINSHHDAPAAVDPEFLTTFIDLLLDRGYRDLAVAEASGRGWAPTSEVFRKKGLRPLLEQRDVPLFNLDEMDWVPVQTGGSYLPTVHIPAILEDYDRLVFMPNMKTHGNTGFTLSIKLAMGFTPQDDRALFHDTVVAGAIADLARVVRPDLVIVDGRTAFIDGGPDFGTRVEPGVLLASGDPVACDIEAVRILLQHGAGPHIGTGDPLETETIRQMGSTVPGRMTVRWS